MPADDFEGMTGHREANLNQVGYRKACGHILVTYQEGRKQSLRRVMRRALYGRALSAKVSVRLTSESYDGGVVHVMRLLFSGLPIDEALALDPRFAGKSDWCEEVSSPSPFTGCRGDRLMGP